MKKRKRIGKFITISIVMAIALFVAGQIIAYYIDCRLFQRCVEATANVSPICYWIASGFYKVDPVAVIGAVVGGVGFGVINIVAFRDKETRQKNRLARILFRGLVWPDTPDTFDEKTHQRDD